MAEKTVLIDDIDGSTDNVETIRFTWAGVPLRLDLNMTHRIALEAALKPYLEAARRDTMKSATSRRTRANAATRAARERGEIRAWAKANHLEAPDRGPIPEHVREAYYSARGDA